MHEFDLGFDLYLGMVRRQLRVGRRRAEAICTELRSHLEAQALQFERDGMSRQQAVAQAVERFGSPQEIAARLVVSNSQYHREEVLKAMWLGLIVGAAIFYVLTVAMYLVHLISIYGITTYWYQAVITGGGVGVLSGLACTSRARLRTIARVVIWVAVVLWIGFNILMYAMNGYHGLGRLLKDLIMVCILPAAFIAIWAAAKHVVNRWVLHASPRRAENPQ
jgi:hypothetical protein